MRQANTRQGFQLVFGPYPAHGVVGIAEQEQLDPVLRDSPLERVEIDRITAIFVHKRGIHHLAPVVLHHTAERVIHRLLDQHRIAWFRECPHRSCKGEHDAGGQHEAFLRSAPAVTRRKPGIHGIVVRIPFDGVAEDAMLRTFGKRIRHFTG